MRSPGRSRWLILVLFIAIGLALTVWEPTRVTLMGPLWLGFSVLVGGFYLLQMARATLVDHLRHAGQPAQAVARSVRETGLVVHEMPEVEMELDVQGPSGGYTVTKKVVVPLSALEPLRRGEAFPVKIDPDDHDDLAFEWGELSDQRASWIARARGGPATIDEAALAREKEHLAPEEGDRAD